MIRRILFGKANLREKKKKKTNRQSLKDKISGCRVVQVETWASAKIYKIKTV